MFRKVILPVLAAVFICAGLAHAKFYRTSGNSGFHAENMITNTTADVDVVSRWVSSPGIEVIWCQLNITAMAGGGTLTLGISQCTPTNVLAGGCTDQTDAVTWAIGSTMPAGAGTDLVRFSALPAAGDPGAAADTETSGPLPAFWLIFGDESGSNTTLEYTVDCMWW